MCGRFARGMSTYDMVGHFEIDEAPVEIAPSWNVAPGQVVAAVVGSPRRLVGLRWGLVPSWARDPAIGNRLINARVETAAVKPSFRGACRSRRCLILADGFYEWRQEPQGRQPFHFRMRGGVPFVLAGLWERWQSGDGHTIETCTILTTAANGLVGEIHERMPVILQAGAYDAWLAAQPIAAPQWLEIAVPFPAEQMESWPVEPLVNDPRHDVPGCRTPRPAADA